MANNRYPQSLKDEVIKFHKEHGNAKTAEKYPEIPDGTWYHWVKAGTGGQKLVTYYPFEFKEEVIAYYKKNGTKPTKKKYPDIPVSTFHSWVQGRNVRKKTVTHTLFKDEVDTYYKKNGKEPIYQKLEIPEPKPVPEPAIQEVKEKKKIYVVVSEDADEIIKVLKGLK